MAARPARGNGRLRPFRRLGPGTPVASHGAVEVRRFIQRGWPSAWLPTVVAVLGVRPVREPSGELRVNAPRLRARWMVISAAIVALAVGGIRACTHKDAQSATASAPGPPPVPVETATATQGDIGVYLTGLGAVTPVYTVTVRTRVDGQLMNVAYRE